MQGERPDLSEEQPGKPPRRRRRLVVIVVLLLVIALATVTARWFVWPDVEAPPAHVDAIVKLGGAGDRDEAAEGLARDGLSSVLVVSTVPVEAGTTKCSPPISGVTVICFNPDPDTTQGEAQEIGRLAAQYHWRSIAVVTTPDQAWRARLRVQRCYGGEIYNSTTPLPGIDWVWAIPYQWGATIKALTFERDC